MRRADTPPRRIVWSAPVFVAGTQIRVASCLTATAAAVPGGIVAWGEKRPVAVRVGTGAAACLLALGETGDTHDLGDTGKFGDTGDTG